MYVHSLVYKPFNISYVKFNLQKCDRPKLQDTPIYMMKLLNCKAMKFTEFEKAFDKAEVE